MPVKGLTDRYGATQSVFAQIGIIRKGGPKRKKGEQDIFGEDLNHFRFELAEGEQEAEASLREWYGYGEKKVDGKTVTTYGPGTFVFILPFNDIERCWEAWREAYVAGAMLHRCDGEFIIREVDHRTGKVIVNNGLSLESGAPVKCPCASDKKGATPALSYVKGSGKTEQVFCKPVGRLRLMLTPPLNRLAYFVLMTGSVHDIIAIDSALKGTKEMFGGVVGIPFLAKRVPREISTPGADGKRARRRKFMIEVEVDPIWMSEKFKATGLAALAAVQSNTALLAAPALSPGLAIGQEDDEEGWVEDATPDLESESGEAKRRQEEDWGEAPAPSPQPSAPVGTARQGASVNNAPPPVSTPKITPSAPGRAGVPNATKASPSPAPPARAPARAKPTAGFLRDPNEWERLMEWAYGDGALYPAGDATGRLRAWKVVNAAMPTFDTGDFDKAKAILVKHYAEKASDEKEN